MKAIITVDAIDAYPDYSIPFHVYTDASDFQLCAAILQNNKPLVAYYSKKITPAQKNYITMEKELLAIVMTLTTYCKLLMGSKVYIYADDKNLTFKTSLVQCILHWRLFVDQFDCELCYIPGKDNVLVDCFLRLPLMEKPSAGIKGQQGCGRLIDFHNIKLPMGIEEILDGETFLSAANQICETIINQQELNNPSNDESFYTKIYRNAC